jgi:pyruvate/2-oxoacid:ferredoxin oxidoreductase alpha subunit
MLQVGALYHASCAGALLTNALLLQVLMLMHEALHSPRCDLVCSWS